MRTKRDTKEFVDVGQFCGDLICQEGEDINNCPVDCCPVNHAASCKSSCNADEPAPCCKEKCMIEEDCKFGLSDAATTILYRSNVDFFLLFAFILIL